jgi:hypothetical protein
VHIVIDVPPDPTRWRAAFRHVLRAPMRRVRVLGGVLILLGLVLILLRSDNFTVVWLSATVIAMGLAYALLLPARAIRRSLRRLPLTLQQPQHIELTDRSLRLTSPLVSSEYAWAAFVRTELVPGYLMLMVGKYQVMPVPVDGLTPAELDQLREFVANQAFIRR